MTHPSIIKPADHAAYSPAKMGKGAIFESPRLLVGLTAFEPGQEHALNAHGIRNQGNGRLLVLAILAPAPHK